MPALSPGACLLFDLDGTLVDTDRVHLAAFNRMLSPYGKRIDAHYYSREVMGFPNPMIMAKLLPDHPEDVRMAEAERKEELFRDMVDEVEPLAGLVDLLDWADAQGCPCGVVTNAPRANAELMLDAIGLAARFRTLVIGDEVARAKPDPLPYLTGLERLGGAAGRAVAFEDSRSGIAAASGAGLATVGIMTSLDEASLGAVGAVLSVRDFADPRVAELVRTRLSG
ncbi:MAG: HAD family phosphatase [Alsobacter sp.]